MGYPTGVQIFTTKQDGVDYPQASHINDLQTEVSALENGLLNGLQHALTVSTGGLTVSTGSVNIGGPSTLTTLSAGASTLASANVSSNLTVGGESTFAGRATFASSVTFSTLVTFHANQTFGTVAERVPCAKLTHSTNVAVGNAAWVGLSWDSEAYDSTGLHSTAANSSRLNLTSSGLWSISVGVEWNNGSSGQRHLRIKLNDTATIAVVSTPQYETNGMAQSLTVDYLASDTTNYVTAVVYQATGSTASLNGAGSTSFGGCWFAAKRISA